MSPVTLRSVGDVHEGSTEPPEDQELAVVTRTASALSTEVALKLIAKRFRV